MSRCRLQVTRSIITIARCGHVSGARGMGVGSKAAMCDVCCSSYDSERVRLDICRGEFCVDADYDDFYITREILFAGYKPSDGLCPSLQNR